MPVATAAAAPIPTGTHCSAGARTLGTPGDRLYPETGNGGYRSVHTNVDMVYDATGNRFLPGNKVELTDRATQCLTEFSLDFEHISADAVSGPNLVVGSVTVGGVRAAFRFVRPTYPGDPEGPNDPNPAADEVSADQPGRRAAAEPVPAGVLALVDGGPGRDSRHPRRRASAPRTSWSSRRCGRSGVAPRSS